MQLIEIQITILFVKAAVENSAFAQMEHSVIQFSERMVHNDSKE